MCGLARVVEVRNLKVGDRVEIRRPYSGLIDRYVGRSSPFVAIPRGLLPAPRFRNR
jgi:hypothetical protein